MFFSGADPETRDKFFVVAGVRRKDGTIDAVLYLKVNITVLDMFFVPQLF